MKSDITVKEFLVEIGNKMKKENADCVEVECTFPSGAVVTLEISIKGVKEHNEMQSM